MLLFCSVSKKWSVTQLCDAYTQSYSPRLPSPQLMCHKSKNAAWNKRTMPCIQIKMNLFTPFCRMWCLGAERNGQLFFFFCLWLCDGLPAVCSKKSWHFRGWTPGRRKLDEKERMRTKEREWKRERERQTGRDALSVEKIRKIPHILW